MMDEIIKAWMTVSFDNWMYLSLIINHLSHDKCLSFTSELFQNLFSGFSDYASVQSVYAE